MNPKRIEIGKKYERLTVVELAYKKRRPSRPNKGWENYYLCLCDCGTQKIVQESALGKLTKSCGCLRKELAGSYTKTHGMWTTKTWKAWSSMKGRCTLKNHKDYKNYGGRGIRVCQQWENSFECFLEDMGEKPEGYTLDRIDVNGDYTPENCRWASIKVQSNNRRNNVFLEFNGNKLTIAQWAEKIGLKYTTLKERIKHGWDVQKALTTPLSQKHSNAKN